MVFTILKASHWVQVSFERASGVGLDGIDEVGERASEGQARFYGQASCRDGSQR